MRELGRCLHAEAIKLRRGLIPWLIVAGPLVVVVIQFSVNLGIVAFRNASNAQVWSRFANQLFFFWTLAILPLLIALEAALLASLEHGSRQWKQVITWGVSRPIFIVGKFGAVYLLMAVSSAILVLGALCAGAVIGVLRPEVPFLSEIPFFYITVIGVKTFLASAAIISLQCWLSLRFTSFGVPVGIGILGLVIGLTLLHYRWAVWFPWLFPFDAISSTRADVHVGVAAGIVGGILIAISAVFDLSHRHVD